MRRRTDGSGGRRGGRAAADEGSASLLVAVWIVVLVLLAATGIGLTSALAARTATAAAADLGALAGASAALEGPGTACRRAADVVQANEARMTSCRLAGAEIRLTVRAPAPAAVRWLSGGRARELVARARAELVADS